MKKPAAPSQPGVTRAFLDLVKQRRSVREFLNDPVDRDTVMMCLEAARLAPSACNSQPWRFIVVDDDQVRERLCKGAFRGLHFFNSFARTAPVIVVIVSEKSRFLARLGGRIKDTRYYLLDIGIAGEHLILQAQELGLGTCWIGWFNEKAVKSVLDIPNNRKIDVMIALGYYDRQKMKSEQTRYPIEELISFNTY